MPGDTIFALASGRGCAGIAVIRLSGPGSSAALAALTAAPPPPPRQAALRRLLDGTGEVLDRALVLSFPAPSSFTGEDVVELHVHGGRAVIDGILAALADMPGLRPADAGEFSRRAVGNGRMDATAAEGLADLIAAETAAQRRQALRQMGGALAALYDGWRERIIHALAYVEAGLDFSDQDLPDDLERMASAGIAEVVAAIRGHLDDHALGERIRDGIEVVVFGPANAGKSTLVNALARREVAIVSPRPGTTRDVIEVPLEIAGYPVVLSDCAGLGIARDEIEAEGMRRAVARATAADLRIAVLDSFDWPRIEPACAALIDGNTLVVVNKVDAAPFSPEPRPPRVDPIPVSALTGEGLGNLQSALNAQIAARFGTDGGPPLTRLRHRHGLNETMVSLQRAIAGGASEVVAEELRQAATALGRITGRIDVEAVLDVVFRDFCIGK